MPEARYSGPGKSGICKCGCRWEQHHLCLVMRQNYLDKTQEQYIPDECCAFGFNEVGGMKFNKSTCEWEDHCYGYEDRGIDDSSDQIQDLQGAQGEPALPEV